MRVPGPVTLSAHGVTLRPLTADDAGPLFDAVGGDDDVWANLPVATPRTPQEMAAIVADTIAQNAAGRFVTFAVVADGVVVGQSSYLDIVPEWGGIEIGWTFYARRVWATRVNPVAKLLLLTHAFEELGAERVSLRTDIRNVRSQAAIERLGATREGVLRRHRPRPDGSWRDTVLFSILRDEWPGVRAGLQDRLG